MKIKTQLIVSSDVCSSDLTADKRVFKALIGLPF